MYVQNYGFWKSIDGGAKFERIPTPHGDEHALWIDPHNSRRMIEGNDGGASVSFNGGATWSSIYNQPTSQLYHVITDDDVPYRVYGSQQDNTAISLPSRSVDGAIHERDWFAPGGGESGYIAIKPDDPNLIVASGPVGRRAYNDIMTLYDRRTGQKWNITVLARTLRLGRRGRVAQVSLPVDLPDPLLQARPRHPLRLLQLRPSLDRSGSKLGGDQSRPDAQRSGETETVRRTDHPRQHRRRGLLHHLRPRRVAAAGRADLGRVRRWTGAYLE